MEYTELLKSISDSLASISKVMNYKGFVFKDWIPLLGTLLAGVIGYSAAVRTIRFQSKKEKSVQNDKKNMIFCLLCSEVFLRWDDNIFKTFIYAYLQKNKNNKKPKNPLEKLEYFSTIQLRDDDMFIFSKISNDFQNYNYLGGASFISKIIHGYILFRDLNDKQLLLKDYIGGNNNLDNKIQILEERTANKSATLQDKRRLTKLKKERDTKNKRLVEELKVLILEMSDRYHSIFDLKDFQCPKREHCTGTNKYKNLAVMQDTLNVNDVQLIVIEIQNDDFHHFDRIEEGKWSRDNETGLCYIKNPPRPEIDMTGNIHISQHENIKAPAEQISWNDYRRPHELHRFKHSFSEIQKAKDLAKRILKTNDKINFKEGISLTECYMMNDSSTIDISEMHKPKIETISLKVEINL